MNPGEKRTFSISYSAQGTAMFSYALALRQMQIRRLDVELSTGFADTVIPDGRWSPPGRMRRCDDPRDLEG